MIVPGSEDDGSSLVADQALGDSGLAEVVRHRSALLQDGVGGEDLGYESVAAGAGLELIDLDEDRLPQPRLRIALLRF